MAPFKPQLIDAQRFPWGVARILGGLPSFHTTGSEGRLARYATEEAAQLAADKLNAQVTEQFRNFRDGIEPPQEASYGTLRWPVTLKDYPSSHAHVNIDHGQYRGKDRLSLTGIPWTLSAADAHIVASALVNAARWLERHPNPYRAETD
ncbi:hypothetical protein SEA_JFLIX2_55 [Rhodococcus phage Jflix2]|nr:hypothetical protein SEA_JFLIX2_55 [Rhodococcus phage Jflix2]